MNSIFRYPLELKETQEILINSLPKEDSLATYRARDQIIKVGSIREIPSIWCIVNPNAPKIKLKLKLYGTGWDSPKAKPENYLGSFTIMDSEIYHIFIDE